MPRNEHRPPPKWEPTPKGYNTERGSNPLDLDSILRNPLSASASQEWSELQSRMTRPHLLWTAAHIFIDLGMPILPDWGIDPGTGQCQCKTSGKNRRRRECKAGKHPAVSADHANGKPLYGFATTRPGCLYDWISQGRNLSAVPYGHVVLDFDCGGPRSFAQWCELAGLDAVQLLDETLVVRSGSGAGIHAYFRVPEDVHGYDRWLPGVDVKGAAPSRPGGAATSKVTLPGSLHETLKRYEFLTFNAPAVVPSVLLDEIRAGRAYELSDVGAARILAPGAPRHNVPSIGFGSTLPPEYEPFIKAHPPRGTKHDES